jgi:hypothetical protein
MWFILVAMSSNQQPQQQPQQQGQGGGGILGGLDLGGTPRGLAEPLEELTQLLEALE